ncbi:MAG: CDP-alcohol phosphatidyltransferase family protein, partial [Pseudonocardia sp.]
MLTLRSGLMFGLIAGVQQLAALAATVGLSGLGWAVGLTCAIVLNAVVARGLVRFGADALGPADVVTLARATCACGVAALVADSFVHAPATGTLLALTAAALVLDAVDGWVARRTRTSTFGALFDGEVDAFLILVLSVYVAPLVGWWVLAIGAARYAFAVSGWGCRWLRGQLPPRYWRKVVAATQGIVLAFAAAELLPLWLTQVLLVAALALLAESFGRDVWWLRRHRGIVTDQDDDVPEQPAGVRRRWRVVAATLTNVLAVSLVWFALVAPNQAHHVTPSAFLRIPVEGLVVACLAIVLPSLARRVMAVLVGLFLGVLAILKILDMGFFAALDRPFNLVTDPGYFGSTVDLVTASIGEVGATLAVIAAAVLFVLILVGMPLSVARLSGVMARHRTWSVRTVVGVLVIWLAFAVSGLQTGQGQPIASTELGRQAVGHVRVITDEVRDEQRFEAAVAVDEFREAPEAELLTGLRGKDV